MKSDKDVKAIAKKFFAAYDAHEMSKACSLFLR